MSQSLANQACPPPPARFGRLGLGLWLLVMVPWLWMWLRLGELAAQDHERFAAEARQILLTEHEDCHRRLDPKRFLQDIHQRIDREEGLLHPTLGPIHPTPRNTDPGLIRTGFAARRRARLTRETGGGPLLVVAVTCDFQAIEWSADPAFIARVGTASIDLLAHALSWEQPAVKTVTWWLATGSFSLRPAKDNVARLGYRTAGEMREKLSATIFGEFVDVRMWSEVSQAYSERLGGHLLYFCNRQLWSSPRGDRGFLGGYVTVFADRSLDRRVILGHALAFASGGRVPGLQRRLLPPGVDPEVGFKSGANGFRLQSHLPPEYWRPTGSAAAGSRGFELLLRAGADASVFSTVRGLTGWLGLLVAVGSGLALRAWLRRRHRSGVGVRWRLVGAVALVMVVPMLGLGLLGTSLLQDFAEQVPARVLERVRHRARLLAARVREAPEQKILWQWRLRRRLEPWLARWPAEFARSIEALEPFRAGMHVGCVVRLDGARFWFPRMPEKSLTDFFAAVATEVLAGLNPTFRVSRTGGIEMMRANLIDDFWALNQADLVLAAEGLQPRSIFSLSENQRMHFFVVAASGGGGPVAVGLIRLAHRDAAVRFLNRMSDTRWLPLIDRRPGPHAEADYAVFLLEALGSNIMSWPRRARFQPVLAALAGPSARAHLSGVIRRRLPDGWGFDCWERVPDSPMLIVATARVKTPRWVDDFAPPLLLLLLAVGMTLALLMADLLAPLLLDPIHVLTRGSELLALGESGARVTVTSGDELARVAAAFNRMADAVQQRERLRRFVPGRLVARVAAGAAAQRGERETGEAVILAADIRGFTTLSERVPPDRLVAALNDYFTEMDQAITGQGGVVLKLIGDAIIAGFFADIVGPATVMAAVTAARAMRARLAEFNRHRGESGRFTIDNGVGLAAGPVLQVELGGGSGRREFTVIGRPVQEAARLEAASVRCRQSRIVVSAAIASLLPASELVGPVPEPAGGVPGRDGFEVVGG